MIILKLIIDLVFWVSLGWAFWMTFKHFDDTLDEIQARLGALEGKE